VKIRIIGTDVQTFLKRAFYLLWLACEGTYGEGRKQDNPLADEQEVWENILSRGDYDFPPTDSPKHEIYGDYVFGRRIKWGCIYGDGVIRFTYPDPFKSSDHEFWRDFETNKDIADAVCQALGCRYEILDRQGLWEMTDEEQRRERQAFDL
jgi:hypothetical protein